MKIKFGVTKNELINKIKSLNVEDSTVLRLSKELTKVKFENIYIYDIERPSWKDQYKFCEVFGTTVLLTYAGGDHEYPVSFILYINDKGKLKGFIPSAGNSYNKDTKQAFGNNVDADYLFLIDLLKSNEMDYKKYEIILQNSIGLILEELTEADFSCIMSEEAMLDDFRLRITNEE